MDVSKEYKVRSFRDWLKILDIQFVEKANGHFQIFDSQQRLRFQVWATTEKMRDQLYEKNYIGKDKLMSLIEEWHAKDKSISAEISLREEVTPENEVRVRFEEAYKLNKGHMYDCILVVAVHLPTGATEIITNHYEVESKMEYYLDKYDNEFRLKANPNVKITGFMLV